MTSITLPRATAQQALEALKFSTPNPRSIDDDYAEQGWKEHNAAYHALRAALAQQAEPMEPVAWVLPDALDWKPRQSETVTKLTRTRQEKYGFTTSLYTAPPQRTMVPLTEEEIDAEWRELDGEVSTMFMRVLRKFARAVEKASWEKNHGQA